MLQVVIVGGGFGGLHAAQALKRVPVRVMLIDRRNFHLFQPLLYQVATGVLSPADIAAPLRSILRKQKNADVCMDEVIDVDPERRVLQLSAGELSYDTVVFATGSRPFYFGHDDWVQCAPGLKTIEDATEIRRRILAAFEMAEQACDPRERAAWLTFVIVGAGATGIELAGALSEIAHHAMRGEFRTIDPAEARIIVLEAAPRVLPPYAHDLSAKAAGALRRLAISVHPGATVTGIASDGVTYRTIDDSHRIETHTVLWAAGVQASPIGHILADKVGAQLDRSGRVVVQPDLTIPGHPEMFVIGDLAHCKDANGTPLPGVAPVAMQQGRYVARAIQCGLRNASVAPFRYFDRGTMATIGRGAAVADIRGVRFNGYLAWLAWLFIHLMYLVEFESRLLVFVQWAWNYLTWNRRARLITGQNKAQKDRIAGGGNRSLAG